MHLHSVDYSISAIRYIAAPDDSGLDGSDLAENSPSAVEALNALDKMNITLLERRDRPIETQDRDG
jgi:hypothetical protein